jgi:hypothetical protein
MASTLETALDAVADALESITPSTKPNVVFLRWRGAEDIDKVPGPMRERAFLLRLGASTIPRSMSAISAWWNRAELQVKIGYNLEEPRQHDVQGLGVDLLPFVDEALVRRALQYGNPFLAVGDVKRLVFISADPPTATSRTYRFDLEWRENV